MDYILIIWLTSGWGTAINSVEFKSDIACRKALYEITLKQPNAKGVCVHEGSPFDGMSETPPKGGK